MLARVTSDSTVRRESNASCQLKSTNCKFQSEQTMKGKPLKGTTQRLRDYYLYRYSNESKMKELIPSQKRSAGIEGLNDFKVGRSSV